MLLAIFSTIVEVLKQFYVFVLSNDYLEVLKKTETPLLLLEVE